MVKHLIKVAEYKEQNKMELTNLALIFGPTLMSPPEHMMANQLAVGNEIKTLAQYNSDLFIKIRYTLGH